MTKSASKPSTPAKGPSVAAACNIAKLQERVRVLAPQSHAARYEQDFIRRFQAGFINESSFSEHDEECAANLLIRITANIELAQAIQSLI